MSPTTSLSSAALAAEDEDVILAAQALEDLATTHQRQQQQQQQEEQQQQQEQDEQQHRPEFIHRVSTYGVVSSAIKTYESTKSRSRILHYGASVVESVARPLVHHLEPLDDFACRQLDRIERFNSPPVHASPHERGRGSGRDSGIGSGSGRRWQSMLLSTSALASSVSDESLKSLRFLLSLLRTANARIHSGIASLQSILSEWAAIGTPSLRSLELHRRVSQIKQELVTTVRWAVNGLSQYAGSALPEPARLRVRTYILSLPARWAAAAGRTHNDDDSSASKHMDSSEGQESESASRLLCLAQETIEILSNVACVVDDTLNSAEQWCDRLCIRPAQKEEGSLAPTATATKTTHTEEQREVEMVDLA